MTRRSCHHSGMKIRHLIAVVPAALLVLTACGSSDQSTSADGPTTSGDTAALLDSAVTEMCKQVLTYIDVAQQQSAASGQSFDRAAAGDEFLGMIKDNSAVWVGAYNEQATATGQPALDPATATWSDMPAASRNLIEQSVQKGVAGSC